MTLLTYDGALGLPRLLRRLTGRHWPRALLADLTRRLVQDQILDGSLLDVSARLTLALFVGRASGMVRRLNVLRLRGATHVELTELAQGPT